ncbi:CaiB/BaiF CoA-transferase family protein [Cupriavidus taiwanensis]|nr:MULTISPECIES: CaiB/BaiF CoA-transferase family protein [Burkholderiaceae]MDT6961760.1 CaiB/BaiF CoA-transferase family protein [Cupriavidus sp. SZY C1]AMR78286.1 CoA-transferase [Cupriavidus nantongensis]AZG14436.1 CoA transferase [Cupriavidus pauculus]MBU67553.1 CoA transferase [Cupriavidus sp.]MBY4732122.1 CoA transferase [Cupriavidus pauculus]
MQKQALGNIRVLDMTRVLAGPWCTQMLGDMGADVIKIEHPSRGDDTRQWGPPYAMTSEAEVLEDSTYFASANRNKRSVGVDIANPDGADLIRKLVLECDIFVENFKVGDLARRGLDYDSLKKINPRLIYCSITGYGQSGPYADRPGYDFVFQGESGLMSITGERDDEPGGGPQKVGIAIADLTTGLYATVAILAALNHRNVTGEGQHIDLALLDCLVGLSSNQGLSCLINGAEPHRWGNAHPSLVPYQVFDTADGKVVVAVGNDSQWQRFCQAIDAKELARDSTFYSASGRIRNREALIAQVSSVLAARQTEHWLAAFSAADIPHGRINTYKEAFAHPQVIHRQMAIDVPVDKGIGSVRGIANPIKFSKTPVHYVRAPAKLGQHTEDVLSDLLELSADHIAGLEERGVISCQTSKKTLQEQS